MSMIVSVIGHGRIASGIVAGLADLPAFCLAGILTRTPLPAEPVATTDPADFFARPADLIIEAAGPGALREHGVAALGRAPVWSVGAVALADAGFRAQVEAAGARSGHRLRLFANGCANMPLGAERLSITMRRPGIEAWSGSLAEAADRFPHELNTAVAAALAGPGIEATRLHLEDSGPDGPHEILLEAECATAAWTHTVRFAPKREGALHPVAAMILEELAREAGHYGYA